MGTKLPCWYQPLCSPNNTIARFASGSRNFLSRLLASAGFAHDKKSGNIVAGLKAGAVDIVIGTHRIASKDVEFQNLGLLIIDEEQRFGVQVKERLKSLRSTVDVLTMTATPIPRTLHMAMTGMRDISNLETPPEERVAVETRVTRWDDHQIRSAIFARVESWWTKSILSIIVSTTFMRSAVNWKRLCPRQRFALGMAKCRRANWKRSW